MAGTTGTVFRKYVEVEMPYYPPFNVPLRGTPEWDEREQRRRAMGYKVISMGPIEPGLGHGETMTYPQLRALRMVQRGGR